MYRKKVLYLTSGATPYRKDFFNAFAEYVDLTVLYEMNISREREWEVTEGDKTGLNEVVLKSWKEYVNCAFCPEVIKYLKKDYDYIIIGGYSTPTGMLAILWLRLHRKKFILNADGGILKAESQIKHFIKRFFISGADGWLSTGDVTTKYFRHYGAKENRIYVYPFTSVKKAEKLSGILSIDEKENYRRELGMNEKRILLLVGQFIHRKGFDVMLQASILLPKEIGVYFVGGVPTDEYKQIQNKNNLHNVHFVGFKQREELKKYYLAADLFVLPTREDIWGLVVNEALAFGLPVITTDACVAGLELIRNKQNGMLVPVENHAVLAKAICEVIESSENLKTMSENALKSIEEYTIEDMAFEHFNIICQL